MPKLRTSRHSEGRKVGSMFCVGRGQCYTPACLTERLTTPAIQIGVNEHKQTPLLQIPFRKFTRILLKTNVHSHCQKCNLPITNLDTIKIQKAGSFSSLVSSPSLSNISISLAEKGMAREFEKPVQIIEAEAVDQQKLLELLKATYGETEGEHNFRVEVGDYSLFSNKYTCYIKDLTFLLLVEIEPLQDLPDR